MTITATAPNPIQASTASARRQRAVSGQWAAASRRSRRSAARWFWKNSHRQPVDSWAQCWKKCQAGSGVV